jgi:hypothetical protein
VELACTECGATDALIVSREYSADGEKLFCRGCFESRGRPKKAATATKVKKVDK